MCGDARHSAIESSTSAQIPSCSGRPRSGLATEEETTSLACPGRENDGAAPDLPRYLEKHRFRLDLSRGSEGATGGSETWFLRAYYRRKKTVTIWSQYGVSPCATTRVWGSIPPTTKSWRCNKLQRLKGWTIYLYPRPVQ